MKRPILTTIAATLLVGAILSALVPTVRFVVVSLASATLSGYPSEKDRKDAEDLLDRVKSAHNFALNSSSEPGNAPVFVQAGSRGLLAQPALLTIYGVLDRPEQDRIIAAVQDLVRATRLRAVRLRFMAYENWQQNAGVGTRGEETQVRLVRVDQNGTKEEQGTKQIEKSQRVQ